MQDRDKTALRLEAAEVKLSQAVTKRDQGDPQGRNSRPTHRKFPLVGPKVDTIEWSASQLSVIVPKVAKMQSSYDDGRPDPVGAVFVEFASQRAAQAAFQTTTYEKPLGFRPMEIGMPPDEVLWKNLGISEWSRTLRRLIASAAIVALILFFTIPVSLIGALTNINYLTDRVPFLGFIDAVPAVIMGVITGLLPAILLALLMALVPVFCRSK